jgi:hypothetical protein
MHVCKDIIGLKCHGFFLNKILDSKILLSICNRDGGGSQKVTTPPTRPVQNLFSEIEADLFNEYDYINTNNNNVEIYTYTFSVQHSIE